MMLKTNEIPFTEPLLRVGIILPEDAKESVTIDLPTDLIYQLSSETNPEKALKSGKYTFHISNEVVQYQEEKAHTWKIEPVQNYPAKAKSGIIIKDVVAGRGFHWQKPIDISVSGSIEIKVYENRLILINELSLEAYLMCVATSEMGAACPPSLIESQTIAARSWMLANIEQKHVAMGMDVCNDDCCQRYQGNANLTDQSIRGALNSSGQVLLFAGKICDARYSKSCGGKMESFRSIWPGPDLPYLKCLPDAKNGFEHPALALSDENHVKKWIDTIPKTFCSPEFISETSLKKYLGNVDEEGSYFRWQVTYAQDEIRQLLNQKRHLGARTISQFIPIKRGGSGRLIELNLIYIDNEGNKAEHLIKGEYQIREAMHQGFLYSSCFYIETRPDNTSSPETFIIRGAGWGHGAGYCQIGALGMSLAGYSTPEILAHYYPGSELRKIY